MSLKIQNLSVSVQTKSIVHGLNLELKKGEIVAIMGPNGSGKSTLANALAGHPKYKITKGKIELDRIDITNLTPDKRAKLGLFLSMQHSPEIHGVTMANFLRLSTPHLSLPPRREEGQPSPRGRGQGEGRKLNPLEFHKLLTDQMDNLHIPRDFAKRYINTGFSGGEKKKAEILQLLMLNPTYAILDETDSGLDVDALKTVAEGINKFRGKDKGVLLITHYNRILEYVKPDVVYVMVGGRIVKTGGAELAKEIEREGYLSLRGRP